MPVRKEIAITAAALAATGVLVGGVAAVSNASPSIQSTNTGYTNSGAEERGGRGIGRGGHAHTQVTGTELEKVTTAVTAEDTAVTIEQVLKDPDGSYDVIGTKDGTRVMLEVSKDLKTIETRTGGPGKDGQLPTPSSSTTSTT